MRVGSLVLALMASTCTAPGAAPSPSLAPSPTPAAAPSPTAPSGSPSPSAPPPTTLPTRTPGPGLDALVRVLVPSWKPSGPALIVSVSVIGSVTLVAVPLGGGEPLPLARISDLSGSVPAFVAWEVRPDGSAIVLALHTSATTSRLAILDLKSGATRWLTPDLGANEVSPVWSGDGGSVYFGRWDTNGDKGVLRIAADGTQVAIVRPPANPSDGSLSTVSRVTADGVVIGAQQFNGPVPWVRDLATGRERSFGVRNADVSAWRSTRPRALVRATTNIGAPGEGYVALWDDVDGTVTKIFDRPVRGADFDPRGTRIVMSVQLAPSDPIRLVVMDANGGNRKSLEGTEDAHSVRWLDVGVVYPVERATPTGPTDVRLVAPEGGASRRLYVADGRVSRIRVVAP